MFDAVFDRLAVGVILLDGDSRVVAANQYARRIFEAGDGLMLRQDRIVAVREGEDNRLQLLISGAGRLRAGMVARHGEATPLSVIVAGVEPADAALDTPDRVTRIVLIADPERRSAVAAPILVALYGLTQREAMLTGVLLDGGKLSQAAVELGITTGTARNYLKQIFAKTETASQAELVSLVLRQAGWLDFAVSATQEAYRAPGRRCEHRAAGRGGANRSGSASIDPRQATNPCPDGRTNSGPGHRAS